jgi:hypothetical protein
MQPIAFGVKFINSLVSFFLNKVSDCAAIHDFHQIGFKIIVSEPKVEVLLRVLFDLLS